MTSKGREIQALSQSTSDITITVPSGNINPELAKLIQVVNNKSLTDDHGIRRRNIDLLEKYLEGWAKEKEVEEEQAKKEEAERAEKLSQDTQEKPYPRLKTLKLIASSMKKAFWLVLDVLKGGLKVLDALSFVAAELTFQTHYEVALKAILFLVTVSDAFVSFSCVVQDPRTVIQFKLLTQHRRTTVLLS